MEFIPEGATINEHCYKEILCCLRSSIQPKRSNFGRTGCCYTTTPLHLLLRLSKRSLKTDRSPFIHALHTHLISHHAISFPFPPLQRKVMWALLSVSQGDCYCHKGNYTGPSCKYLSAVLPAAIPIVGDLHSIQQCLF
jgi:hypothetical protein